MGCKKLTYHETLSPLKVVCSNLNISGISCVGSYRYGFNGMERDDEVKGAGNHYDLGLRNYDPRLGRMFSIDPRANEYPWQTTYAYHRNSPIMTIDYLGGGDFDDIFDQLEDGTWEKREGVENDGGDKYHFYHFKNGDIGTFTVSTAKMVINKSGSVFKEMDKYRDKQAGFYNGVEKIGSGINDLGDGVAIVGYGAAPFTKGTSLSIAVVGEGISWLGKGIEHFGKIKRDGFTNENKVDIAVDAVFEIAPAPIELIIKKSNIDKPAKKILKAEVNKLNYGVEKAVEHQKEKE